MWVLQIVIEVWSRVKMVKLEDIKECAREQPWHYPVVLWMGSEWFLSLSPRTEISSTLPNHVASCPSTRSLVRYCWLNLWWLGPQCFGILGEVLDCDIRKWQLESIVHVKFSRNIHGQKCTCYWYPEKQTDKKEYRKRVGVRPAGWQWISFNAWIYVPQNQNLGLSATQYLPVPGPWLNLFVMSTVQQHFYWQTTWPLMNIDSCKRL